MRTLSARERKLVAVALAMAAVAFVLLGLVQPLVNGFSDRAEQRVKLRQEYAQNERLIARIPILRRAYETQARQQAEYGLVAKDSGEAGELLKIRLSETLAKAGGEMRGTDAVESEPGWVRASVSGTLSYDQLLTFLDRLENDPPFLTIDSLAVNADRAVKSNALEPMDVQLEASIPFAPAKSR